MGTKMVRHNKKYRGGLFMTDDGKEISGNDKPSNQLVVKLFQLISFLAKSKAPLRLQEIAAGTGIPQPTVLRYLNALIQEGFAYQDEFLGRYALTWRICSIGVNVRNHLTIRTLTGELINDLSRQLGLGCSIVVEHDMECVYLDCVYEPDMMGPTLQRIGKQSPLYSTSSGKLFLTGYSEAEIDRMIEEKKLKELTPNTIRTKERLMEEIEKVRQCGFAMDNEECERNLRCIAYPIYDYTERLVAAVSCFGSVDRMTDQYVEETIKPVCTMRPWRCPSAWEATEKTG